jgi:hypothetical protein
MPDEPETDDVKELKILRREKAAGKAAAEQAAADRDAAEAAEAAKFDDAVPVDDPPADTQLHEMKRQRALADANKPIEPAVEAFWSSDPDKLKAREAIEKAYREAAREGSNHQAEGELLRKWRTLDDKFVNAAADMLRSGRQGLVAQPLRQKDSHLVTWINTYLAKGQDGKAVVRDVLVQRQQLKTRLTGRLGPREKKRQEAIEDTKRWETAYGRWSAPGKEIAAVMASYADRIDQLNADINTNTNNNRDQAIFSFWFEVAPSHLQLRPAKLANEPPKAKDGEATAKTDDASGAKTAPTVVSNDIAPGVTEIWNALKSDFPELLPYFQTGADRGDGSVYLIDPDELATKRQNVLTAWQEAAQRQAAAEADYATRPDATADLKPRYDKLKDDGWVKGTREALAPPKP